MATFPTIPAPPAVPTPGQTRPVFTAAAYSTLSYFSSLYTALNSWVSALSVATAEMNIIESQAESAKSAAMHSALQSSGYADSASASNYDATTAKNLALTYKDAAATSATNATTKATEAASSAATAVNAAGNNIRGVAPERAPSNAMLGTAAYLDQTWLRATTTWDAASVANTAQVSTTVAVPGAEIGDKVLPSASIALSGLSLRGEVTAAAVVTLYLLNVTGAAVDLASATYYISVLKRTPAR